MKPIIKAENLSKQYRIGVHQSSHPTLRDLITEKLRSPFGWLKGNGNLEKNSIWALKDITFELMPGEILGVIGHNGAGKSTLLKILSRITEPTTGSVDIFGRVGSLLEVGTGFHGELTGRENVYLNGAILGMKRVEIDSKFDDIVAFAEIEKFIDTPVKHYSSGMYMRLAFAVAAHLEPEILIVDEVLAVGDAEFQKKCIGKMEDISKHGRTILFVSHNLLAMQSLCTRVIYLEKGKIVKEGETNSVISLYRNKSIVGQYERIWDDPSTAPGNDEIRLHSAKIFASDGTPTMDIDVNTPLQVEFDYWNYVEDASLHINLIVKTAEGYCAFITASSAWTMPAGLVNARCHIPGQLLNDGTYSIDLYICRDGTNMVYTHNDILVIEIKDEKRKHHWYGKWGGVLRPQLQWDRFQHQSRSQGQTFTSQKQEYQCRENAKTE